MIDDAEPARLSILGFGEVFTAPGRALASQAGRGALGRGPQGVFDRLQEALGDGQVEELYTMRLGVGVK